MATRIDQPCKDGLSAACFAQEPNFAKRAFSFRLLNAFVPPKLSRRLLTFLGLIRFDPAGNLPDWLNLPPWWIILPGAIIPPGWKFGDPIFDGVYEIPNFFQGRDYQYPVGPDFLSPGSAGSGVKSKSSVDQWAPWFYDDFTVFDLSYWEIWEEPGTSVTPSTGQVRFQSPGSPDYCGIRSLNANDTVPTKFVLSFRLSFIGWGAGTDYLHIRFNTGSHAVRISFVPPTTVGHADLVEPNLTVAALTSTQETWSLVYNDGYADLYRGAVKIDSMQHHQHYSGNPGKFEIWNNNELHCILHFIKVVEY